MDSGKIKIDEGYTFGLGCFETILVDEKPLFLKEHLERLNRGLSTLNIQKEIVPEDVFKFLKDIRREGTFALKIMASSENVTFTSRDIPYKKKHYDEGVRVKISRVMRNESSPFTYIKSLCYGDNILEKRSAADEGFDEVIFKNTRGNISEGAVSNIFFIRDNVLITPDISSGLLPGIIRKEIVKEFSAIEREISLYELENMDGMFITNSLMGVLWVNSIENVSYRRCELYDKIKKWYCDNLIERK